MKSSLLFVAAALLTAACGGDPGPAGDPGGDGGADGGLPDGGPPAFHPDGVTTLATGEDHPNGIVADETAAYWVANVAAGGDPAAPSTIRRLDLTTRAITTLASDAGNAFRIFADDDELFVGTGDTDGRILAFDKQTGAAREVLTGLGDFVDRLALDGDRIYFTGLDPVTQGQVVVRSVRKDGGDPQLLGTVPSDFPYDVIVDDTRLFVAGGAAIFVMPKTGGAAATLVTGRNGRDLNLAQDRDFVYFTNRTARTVERVRKDGTGMPETLATQQQIPGRLVVADGTLYWTTRGGFAASGTVARRDLASGGTMVIATGQDSAAEIAVLREAIIWSNLGPTNSGPGNGSVMAAPR